MWGGETQAGPEEESPRDQSKGRMRHETKYPLLEDCGKTKQREWSSVTFWSWPCVRNRYVITERDGLNRLGAKP